MQRHRVFAAAALCALILSGCDEYPMDVEATTQNVLRNHTLHAGIVAGSDDQEVGVILQAVGRMANASIDSVTAQEGELLRELEQGGLDLVVGEFANGSPWSKRVTFTTSPVAKDPPKDKAVPRAALMKGENRWFMFVENAMKGAEA